MDAVKFVKEYLRMCSQPWDCEDCPLNKTDFCSAPAKKRPQEEAEKIVQLVGEWAAAHPRKTRQDLFLEQWPNARVDSYGVLEISPCSIDTTNYDYITCKADCCEQCRREFWPQEVK